MITIGLNAKGSADTVSIASGSSDADRAANRPPDCCRNTNSLLIKGIQFSERHSRAAKIAQTLVGKDGECARETRSVGNEGAGH